MEQQATPQATPQGQDFRHIVRIANTDLDGKKSVYIAIKKIKGVGFMVSNMVCRFSGIPRDKRLGELSDAELQKLQQILSDIKSAGAPLWMLNRRKDRETGAHLHLLATDLTFVQDNDIKNQKKMRSYVGVRHILGQPVRGQRTQSHFRKNKGKVSLGVKRREGAKAGKV